MQCKLKTLEKKKCSVFDIHILCIKMCIYNKLHNMRLKMSNKTLKKINKTFFQTFNLISFNLSYIILKHKNYQHEHV